jgi:hypothetical protein
VVHDDYPVKFLLNLLLMTALSALAGAAWVAHRPRALPTVILKDHGKAVDMTDEIKQAVIKGSAEIEISETEINRHLEKVLTARMAASLEKSVRFEKLHFDFDPGIAHATLVWDIAGQRQTATMDLAITHLDKVFRVEVIGGAYGHLQVPRGLMRPLRPALISLSTVLKEEVQALFQMNQVRIAEGKLLLDPRFP